MSTRLITFAMVVLCAVQMHAGAATFLPVEDGLRPVYERLNAIEAEVQTLKTTQAGLAPQAEERSAIEEKIKVLELEKGRLTVEVLQARRRAGSSLVNYMGP